MKKILAYSVALLVIFSSLGIAGFASKASAFVDEDILECSPSLQTVLVGETVSFSVTAVTASEDRFYVWHAPSGIPNGDSGQSMNEFQTTFSAAGNHEVTVFSMEFGNDPSTCHVTVTEPEPETSTVKICKMDDEENLLSGWNLLLNDGLPGTEGDFSGVTGSDGCVSFENIPYGHREVFETMQDGWENVSGLGDVTVDEPIETFTVVNHYNTPDSGCDVIMPTGTVENGNATLVVPTGACSVEVTFASYSHAGTIMPLEDQVLVDHITGTYGPGTHLIGPLDLACNWQTDLYTGPVQAELLPPPYTGQTPWGLTPGTILLGYDYVQNQECGGDVEQEDMVLTVIKNVVGGTATSGQFMINVNYGTSTPVSFPGNASGTEVSITASTTYSVSENSDPAGYTASFSADCAGVSANNFHPRTCVITNTFVPPSENTATLHATKIVCSAETDLPNWSGGDNITADTATNFLATHPNCHLEPNWQFQVAYRTANNLIVGNDPGGSFVGATGTPYVTLSGVTNASGTISTTFDSDEVWHIYVREVLKDGYIPFAAPENGNSTISAEMYCGSDVLNYDNLEIIDGPFSNGQHIYCIALNVPKPSTVVVGHGNIVVTKVVINDNNGNKQISDFPLKVGTTTVASGATTTFAYGTYSVSETFDSSLYAQSFSGDCDSNGNITLNSTTTKTCVITNNDIAPIITDDDDDNGGGSSRSRNRSSNRITVQGISTETEPEVIVPQVLGVQYEIIPGLPSTGLGPISLDVDGPSNVAIVIFGLLSILSLNIIAIYAIRRRSL